MPFFLSLLALLAAAFFWAQRARTAARGAQELAGMASDVMAAARRFGFRRKLNTHPVDSLDDPDLAIAAAGMAFMELGGLPTAEQQDALAISLQAHLSMDHKRAEEALILGRWLVTECQGAEPGLTRLAKRLYKMQGAEGLAPLMSVVKDVAAGNRGGMSDKQRDAIAEIGRIYRVA
jgi:hypothetical protein